MKTLFMFDKTYFEKEFPKHLEQFKKNSKQEEKTVFVLGGNQHIAVSEIQDIKEDWISFWIEDPDYRSEKKSAVLMISRYDQIRQILFYPSKSDAAAGFRSGK